MDVVELGSYQNPNCPQGKGDKPTCGSNGVWAEEEGEGRSSRGITSKQENTRGNSLW